MGNKDQGPGLKYQHGFGQCSMLQHVYSIGSFIFTARVLRALTVLFLIIHTGNEFQSEAIPGALPAQNSPKVGTKRNTKTESSVPAKLVNTQFSQTYDGSARSHRSAHMAYTLSSCQALLSPCPESERHCNVKHVRTKGRRTCSDTPVSNLPCCECMPLSFFL
jgi:hypothetical protein